MRQWQDAGKALADVRREELRRLSDADALDAANALLELLPFVSPRGLDWGLIEQQRLFHSARM